jgi:hypothetical protein
VPDEAKAKLTFYTAETLEDVLKVALMPDVANEGAQLQVV